MKKMLQMNYMVDVDFLMSSIPSSLRADVTIDLVHGDVHGPRKAAILVEYIF